MGDLFTPVMENTSKAVSSSPGIQPRDHNALENSAVGQAQQDQALKFGTTSDSSVRQRPSCTEPTSNRSYQTGIQSSDQNLAFRQSEEEEYSVFHEAEWAELLDSDPLTLEGIDSQMTDVDASSSPITIGDYNVCSAEWRNGILVIEDIIPEVRHSLPSSSSLRGPSIRTATDTDYLSYGVNLDSNLRVANAGLSVNTSLTGKNSQYDPHPIPLDTPSSSSGVAEFVNCVGPSNVLLQSRPSTPVPHCARESNSGVELNVKSGCTSNAMQNGLPSAILDNNLASSSRSCIGTSSDHSRGKELALLEPAEENAVRDSGQNRANELHIGTQLLIEKQLSKTDLRPLPEGSKREGILLPKRSSAANFSLLPQELEKTIEMHDGQEEGRIWDMKITMSTGARGDYWLKNFDTYAEHHQLREGDWLQIHLEVHSGRHVVTIKRRLCDYITHSLDNIRQLNAKSWDLVLTKKISKTDVVERKRVFGSIYVPKKEITAHFPNVPDKEGVQMSFYDFNYNISWVMKLTFEYSERRGRTYVLRNAGQFSKHYDLKEGSLLCIHKSREIDASYALTVTK